MRILVTGGCGFIGSHFVRRLVAAGEEVVVLDKLTYSGNLANLDGIPHEFVQGDIADPVTATGAADGCQAIVNFAAETHVDRSILAAGDFITTDVFGTHVLLEFARVAGIRFVQVSTDEVYGDLAEGESATEDDPLRPSSPYAASKAGGDLQVLAYVRTYGTDAVITRGANTYGPFQYPEKLIPLFVTNALDGEPLPVYGDGRQRREWLHAEDHCAAIELALRKGEAGGVYNVGGEERENLGVTKRILELTGADAALVRHVDDRPGHDRRYSVDDSRMRALGWLPERSFDEGLEQTVAWYRERRDWWEPIKSGEYAAYYKEQYARRLGD
ncbi:MAG: dTDP-glucose 4,6-dehydratase [Gaiellaceae bacterium]